jgi:HKD family nuclease
MNIINNTNGLLNDVTIDNTINIPSTLKNHRELIQFLMQKSTKVTIVSPFLMTDFKSFFDSLDIESTEFELITTCAPIGSEQFTKPFQMKNFGDTLRGITQKWPTIHLINSLHSKIYLFYKQKIPLCAIVSSANFTNNGLFKNHETGILTTNQKIFKNLEDEIQTSLDFVNLAQFQLDTLCVIAEHMKKLIRYEKQENIDIGLLKNIEKNCTPSIGNREIKLRENTQYYISLSGVSDRPVLPKDKRKYDEAHTDLWFAKEPKNMKLGDCILLVAVGGKCFLSYYSIASAVFERNEEEKREDCNYNRWPYYAYANNLSLNYGEKWFETPLYYGDIIEKFKIEYPNINVTSTGKDTFVGAIQMGHSYIKVTKEFGEFVKKIIDQQ